MASVSSSLNPFCLKSLYFDPSQCQLSPKTSYFGAGLIRTMSKSSIQAKPMVRIRAARDEVRGGDAVVAEKEASNPGEVDKLKKQLLKYLKGSEGGDTASAETKSAITETITDLECNNPTPVINEGLSLFNGNWTLGYSTLNKKPLPLVKIAKVLEVYDSKNFIIVQTIEIATPLSTISIINTASFQVRSPKQIQIEFTKCTLGTSFNLPVGKELWLVVTYIDEDLRIERGSDGLLVVFIKDGSSLLTP